MAIYVDDTQNYGEKGDWCHLWTDAGNEQALHAFAASLGLQRRWCHVSQARFGAWPHYDLRPSKRALALRRGAVAKPLADWMRETYPNLYLPNRSAP